MTLGLFAPIRAVAGAVRGLLGARSVTLTSSQQKAIRSLEKQIQIHSKKLDDFIANPTIRPGMRHLPKKVIMRQQQVRIKHLKNEINTFKKNIKKIKNGKF